MITPDIEIPLDRGVAAGPNAFLDYEHAGLMASGGQGIGGLKDRLACDECLCHRCAFIITVITVIMITLVSSSVFRSSCQERAPHEHHHDTCYGWLLSAADARH